MKKLLVSALLAVSCSAFAGVPAGYEDAPAPDDNTSVFVNKDKQAVIYVTVLAQQEEPAKTFATEMVKQLKCENSEVQGDDSMAGFENCDVNGQKMNIAIVSAKGKTVMIMANDKASDEDVTAVLSD